MLFKNHKRLKPKAKKLPKYLKWFHEVEQPPCFVCGTFLGIEAHHNKENSTDERIDDEILPLCHEHHHGNKLSPHGTPREWKQVYTKKIRREFSRELFRRYKEMR